MNAAQGRAWIFVAGLIALMSDGPATRAADTTLELQQTIVLKGKPGKMDHLTVDTKRGRLLLANKVNNTLDIVDLKAGKLLKQISGQSGAQGVAYAPDVDKLFVALGTGGLCNIFDGETYKLVKTVKFADDADNVRYNPRTHLVYVAHAEKSMGVIDAKTYELKADIKLAGTAEGFQLDPARPRLYVAIPSPNQLAVIDTDKNQVTATHAINMAGGAHPVILDEANHRLAIGCRKAPMIVVMDSETGKEISSVPIPGEIDDLFFDAKRKRLYACCGEGFLAVLKQIDADHYEVQEKIATAKDARTCYFDAESGKLYLAVPRQEGKEGPEIRMYQAKP